MKKAIRFSPFAALRAPQAAELSGMDKLLLSYLCWRRGGNPTAYPSLKRIETDLQIHRGTCVRTIARLISAGCIRKVSGGGRRRANHYEILSGETVAGGDPLSPEKGSRICSEKGREYVEKGSRGATRTTKNNNRTPPTGVQGGDQLSQKATVGAADFERFWTAYPKKVGKVRAFEEWGRLSDLPGLVERIIASVEDHIQGEQWHTSLAENGGRYIPSPARFLSDRRWEDEPQARPEPQWPDPDDVSLDAYEVGRQAMGRSS